MVASIGVPGTRASLIIADCHLPVSLIIPEKIIIDLPKNRSLVPAKRHSILLVVTNAVYFFVARTSTVRIAAMALKNDISNIE